MPYKLPTGYFAELDLSFRTNMAITSSDIKIYFNLQHFFQSVQNNWIGNIVVCLDFTINC